MLANQSGGRLVYCVHQNDPCIEGIVTTEVKRRRDHDASPAVLRTWQERHTSGESAPYRICASASRYSEVDRGTN